MQIVCQSYLISSAEIYEGDKKDRILLAIAEDSEREREREDTEQNNLRRIIATEKGEEFAKGRQTRQEREKERETRDGTTV